ncbi:protein kinase domain-containing protein [Candidatus Uabimicrobium amorphum]|uniref:non-specific serine/threonine protein kinase n=1 Tax=Uabimicrobium amorphum TaxID=2596890 RepID=A0A5S9F1U7_UABAM|nr:protein kinase [Candidatus Uabimicrobium amorphum]BBM82987.1 serine/threonine protein kinase [Candidatus Uabimicrobium amorphum]
MLSDQDKLFAQYALNKGFINKQILNHYLAQQHKSTLQDYLQKNQLLTLEQIATVHSDIQSSICPLRLERYTILGKIGQGGMGSVYKVNDQQLQRIVALKTISPESNYDIQRFLREARTMASLKHPNILSVIDLGVDGSGQPYFTMEYITGKTLKERPLSTRKIITIMIEVCKAIQYAHNQGVIHRDLKPSNIMLDGNKPIIMDFGLAKVNHDDKKLSKSNEVLGTLQYMPPEQALGRGNAIDHRSDIYSLGAILFYLLTGAPPFTGSSINVIFQLTQEPVKFTAKSKKRIPQKLQSICLKAMAKEKENRYQSAEELASDLDGFLQGKGVAAQKQKQVMTMKKFAFVFLGVVLLTTWFFATSYKPVMVTDKKQKVLSPELAPPKKSPQVISPTNPYVFRGDIARTGVYFTTDGNSQIQTDKSKAGTISSLNLTKDTLYYGSSYQKQYSLVARNKNLKIAWQDALSSPVASFPLIVENFIYVGTKNGEFHCIDIQNQFPKPHWSIQLNKAARFDSPIFYQGIVYVSDQTNCYALDMHSGKTMWQFSGNSMTSPAIYQEVLYIGDTNSLYALSPKSGRNLWETKTKVACTPAIHNDKIFYHSTTEAYCTDLKGKKLWSIPSQSNFKIQRLFAKGPVLYNDMVYWLAQCRIQRNKNYFSEIHAMQITDGKIKWQTVIPHKNSPLEQRRVQHAPILIEHAKNSGIFVVNKTASMFVLDYKSGKQMVHYQMLSPKKLNHINFLPILNRQTLYIPSRYKIEKRSLPKFLDKYRITEINEQSIEGEHFLVASKYIEDMNYWGSWSNGQHLRWHNDNKGQRIAFSFIAPQEGEYNIQAYFTLNKHYGKYKVTINDYQFLEDTSTIDLYAKENGYHRSQAQDLGLHKLRKGKNLFIIHCVGKNPRSRDYRFGLDNIVLQRKPSPKLPTSHLVAYLPFDNDCKDHSPFKNLVHNKGNVSISPGGVKGKCANFDGKSFLTLKEKMPLTQKFTFCVWLYHAGLEPLRPILSKFAPKERSSYRFMVSSQTPKLQLWCFSPHHLSPLQFRVPNKKWYMLTVTYNGSKAKFYLDGKWKSSVNFYGKIATSLNDLHIGFTDSQPKPFVFRGKMDELRIYNRVLTAEEIKNLYKK